MRTTIDRYVFKEILPPFFLALLIFTFLLVLPPVMDSLENLLAKGVTWGIAARILWTLLPQALGLTIPMAVLVGVLIGLGRMSGDRESVALLACGVSPYRLLRPIGALALITTAVTTYVMIVAIPNANQSYREITFGVVTQMVETDIRPRVFYQQFPGWVLYPREEPEPGQSGWKKLMVASNAGAESTIYFAERGRLVIDKEKRAVDLVLSDGYIYKTGTGDTGTTRFTSDMVLSLNADAVFPKINLQPGLNEKTITQLKADADVKRAKGMSTHPEVVAIQQKFSFPMACLVFALIGLALGLSVAREGKMASFVIGVLVIFAYYIVMFLSESLTKGHYLNMYLSRWMPNILLGIFGVAALVWRSRFIDGLPISLDSVTRLIERLRARWRQKRGGAGLEGATPLPLSTAGRPAKARGRAPVLVIRLPRVHLPAPGLLDRYISRMYVKIVGLSFFALLGLFHISTFLDKSDKIFKGQATTAEVGRLLVYMTPQFVFFVIPMAALLSVLVTFGLLSRNSELTVMKACGISLYRASLSVIVLSLVFSVMIFQLEQRLLASSNRKAEVIDAKIRGRTPRVFDALNRQWVLGRDGAIYHYSYFNPDAKELATLRIYQPAPDAWRLRTQTVAVRATHNVGWVGHQVRIGDFSSPKVVWQTYAERPLLLEPPDYFETEQPVAEMMSIGELRRYVNELSASGLNVVHLAVELQHKMAFPFVTLVMTLLAIPFGVSTGKRGALYAVGLGIVLALSYWIISSLFVALGKSGVLTPWLAAWSPNIIVLGASGFMFLTVKT
jgi:LPS export ABC transporter permease LptG/LPS export ABC transporter permease LptF